MARKATRTLNIYEAKDGFRWNLWYGGKIIAESGQAYERRPSAEAAARKVFAIDYPIRLTVQRYIANRLVWVREVLR